MSNCVVQFSSGRYEVVLNRHNITYTVYKKSFSMKVKKTKKLLKFNKNIENGLKNRQNRHCTFKLIDD